MSWEGERVGIDRSRKWEWDWGVREWGIDRKGVGWEGERVGIESRSGVRGGESGGREEEE